MATLSIRAYAKHRGVSDAAVRRARFRPKPAASPVPEPSTGISLQKSRANKELFEALLKKLEYEERSGKLVEISRMEMDAFAAARAARDKLLGIPDRIAPILVGMTDIFEIKEILRKEILATLQNLTDFLHAGTESG